MSNFIDVKEALGIAEERPALFFQPVGPDRYAAMDRKRITESIFEEWFRKINYTNTRGIPKEIMQLYEEATLTLCRILHEEENIIKGGRA